MHIYYRKKIIVEKFTKESENNPISYSLSFFVCIHLCFYVHIKKKPNVAQICGLPRWHSSENLPVNAGDAGVVGSTPELGRFPGEGNATHSSFLAWRIPWTEEPGAAVHEQRVGCKESDMTE